MNPVVWKPKRDGTSNTEQFMALHGIADYPSLSARSIADPEWFWAAAVEFLGLPFQQPFTEVRNSEKGRPWTTWFTNGQINLSEACVDRWAVEAPNRTALVGVREVGEGTSITFSGLLDQVGRAAGGLIRLGIEPGDAVAVYLPMSPEAVVAFLAIARVGGVFIPIFSGYGAEAVAARLTDPRPRALICADGFTRRGKPIAMKETADQAVDIAGGIETVIVVGYAGLDAPMSPERDVDWGDLLNGDPAKAVATDAEHPVLLAYTSGTTGRPKGAVHVHGGLTAKLAQEGAFQAEIRAGDRIMWVTDMGWIMGPWMVVAGLANGAGLVTFDGAPDYPGPDRLWEIVATNRINFLGISPTLIRALQPHGSEMARRHDLSSLRTFGSTGETWNPDPWWWLFRDVGSEAVPIVNISGGTEIGACILSVNLQQGLKPTSVGGPSLGMDADVFDAAGRPMRGEVGELVIKEAWPAMTRGFWGESDRYIDTYWSRWEGVWVHGDWASIDEEGFWYLHGRSDDTLNIAGKRIGPAEIESAAVALPEVVMAAAIGIPDPIKGEAVVVYAVPAPSVSAGPELAAKVSEAVASTMGRAFRPKQVVLVDDLPRTRSAKIMRRVIKALALGEPAGDLSSLENPGSLEGITKL